MPTLLKEGYLLSEFQKRAKTAGLTVDCPSSGNPNSKLVILSEAPGDRETRMRMPMVGGAGAKLWDCLRKHNLGRKDFYCTNVIKRQVSLNAKSEARRPVPRNELDHWEGLLDWELDQLPNVKWILCLGNYALHALTGDWGITNWRGSVFDCTVGRNKRKVKVICTFNPAHILRDTRWEPIFKLDLDKLQRVMHGNYTKHNIIARINYSFEEASKAIDTLSKSTRPIAFDIETISGETACIGFADNPNEGICINFRDSSTNIYPLHQERLLRIKIQRLFSNHSPGFIAQNGTFDSYWLWYKDRIHVPKIWFDTLLAHHTLYPRLLHNLGFLTAQYTNHPYYKDEGKTWREGGNINQFWEYNVKDCCITFACYEALLKELKQQKMDDFFFNHVMRLQPHLIRMTVSGVKVDKELKDTIGKELTTELDDLKEKFYTKAQKLTGEGPEYRPNTNAYKQMQKLYFDKLGLVGRGLSTNETNRDRMRNHPSTTNEVRELLTMIDKIKKEDKYLSTYVTSRIDEDGRIRCEYKQYGTQEAPGRLSSTGTMWGSGMNLQNQPHRAYPMFIADDGYMLSYFDLRQAEAKVVAYIWNVQGLIDTFKRAETEQGFDVHRGNASRIFKLPYEDIPTQDYDTDFKPTRRFLGKKCVHGLNYRMQAPRLAEECNIPLNQAYEAFASYHRAFPEIQKGWEDTISRVREDRELYTPLGRRMIFLEQITEDSFDSVIAFVPQSTIGDKVSQVIYQSEDDERWPKDARIWMNIHDALIALHRPEDKEVVQQVMKEHAESPIIIKGEPVTILTDLKESVADEQGVHRWSTLIEIN